MDKRLLALAIVAVAHAFSASAAQTAVTASTRAPTSAEPLRLRIELGGAIGTPTWFALAAPDRLVVDLPGGHADATTTDGHGAVRRVRLAQFDRATARVVIDLAEPARILRAEPADGGVTLLLTQTTARDFARLPRLGRFSAVAPTLAAYVSARPPASEMIADIADTPSATPNPPRTRARTGALPLVVLDPGHGGHDVGAVSVFEGRFEKDATLAVARAAARALRQTGRFRVALTRADDRFIELGERVAIARRQGAALFLSIHADSAPNPDARGATVYTLSDIASDKMAARLAARENRADPADPAPSEPEIATVLYDLTRRGAMNGSARFAETLQHAMPGEVAFTGNYHRFAGFRVLKTVDMPAALFETGYVTNEADARFLFSAGGQRALGQGIAAAVDAYFAPRIVASAVTGVEGGGGTR